MGLYDDEMLFYQNTNHKQLPQLSTPVKNMLLTPKKN